MNFEQTRKIMVESQLLPQGITDKSLLDTFLTVPRDAFLPDEYKETCYKDTSIALPNGRCVVAPVTLAKLIAEASLQKEEVVLCVGDISGYAAALLSHLCSTVVRVEEDPHAIAFSEEIYQKLDMMNIVSVEEKISHGDIDHAPFDKIILCGASAYYPDQLAQQLSDGGVFCYVHRENPELLGTLMKITRHNEKDYTKEKRGQIATPYCLGYEPELSFALG